MARFRSSLFCSLFLIALDAHAQPASDSAATEADSFFQKGNAHYEKKEWAAAEADYERALALKRTHDIASNLGYSEMRLSKYVEAAEHLSLAAKLWPPTVKDDDRRKGLLERLATVKKEVVTLTIEVNQAGAQVSVNGTPAGSTPLQTEAFAAPGEVVVRAVLSGFRDATQELQGQKGTEKKVLLSLQALPIVAPTASVTTGPTATSTATSPPTGPRNELVIGGGVLAGAALIAGVGLLVGSETKRSDAAAQVKAHGPKPCSVPGAVGECKENLDTLRARDALGNAGIGVLIGAGIVGAATLGYWVFARRQPTAGGVQVVPVAGLNAGGFVVRGNW